MNKVLLIDGNSIGFAAQNGTRLTVGEREVQAVFGFLRTLHSMLVKFPGFTPIVLWDGKADWRFELFPGYKDREGKDPKIDAMRKSYKEQRPEIAKALHLLGVRQAQASNMEADDLAASFSKKLSENGKEVVLVTGDQDWIQLVNENVSWFEHRKDTQRFVKFDDLFDVTGCLTTEAFIQCKALCGDTSDTIPGVGGIGAKGAPEFIATYGSPEGFFELADSGRLPKKLGKTLERFAKNEAPKESTKYGVMAPMRDAYFRNMKLVNLSSVDKPAAKNHKIIRGEFNAEGFKSYCEDRLFRSIIAKFDGWTSVFCNAA